MIVEEKKAGEYRCCFIGGAHCHGSRCMAWRWADDKNPDYIHPHPMQHPPIMPWDNPITIKSTTHGYCGLAGRP
jgi:hypothetical protein